jgi:asparagine synthetase B (glutamine-hydrolysing)
LHLRGEKVFQQPASIDNLTLLWNGEIFGGLEVPIHVSDTKVLLCALKNNLPEDKCFSQHVLLTFSKIEGPYAFVLIDHAAQKIWYGRDPRGRRSLLIKQSQHSFELASVVPKEHQHDFSEVPVSGIFCLAIPDYRNASLENSVVHLTWPLSFTPNISSPSILAAIDSQFFEFLRESVNKRVISIPSLSEADGSAPVALLFSGGLDSTVLAALLDLCLPRHCTIDLLNVAFENPRFILNSKISPNDSTCFDFVPDRISAKMSFEELFGKSNSSRKWNLVEINVSKDLFETHKSQIIELMYPNDTVMDLSISAPFYFCSRGIGICDGQPFTSKSKILFLGFAADELLGGYSRYRSKFESFGEKGVNEEMQIDFNRMWHRNLGRDDRILSNFGKECRYPFLDESFVQFVRSLSLNAKADFTQPRGVGEKIILRRLAASMGLQYCSSLPKRAIQFGAKTANMTAGSQSGTDKISE